MRNQNPEFLKLLITNKIVTPQEIADWRIKYQMGDFAILAKLVARNIGEKSVLCRLWGDSIGVAFVDIEKIVIQENIAQKLPETVARRNKSIPLFQFGDRVTVALADPTNDLVVKEVERFMGLPVSPVFGWPDDIEDAIAVLYQSDNSLFGALNQIASNPLFSGNAMVTEDQIKRLSNDQAVIEFTRGLLFLVFKERGSDLHLEPGEDIVRVRFRIDGVLQERLRIDSKLLPPIVVRLKVLANLDITEKRRPLDGRITLPLPNRSIDFRFSSVPTIYGEKVVLRVLGQIHKKEVPGISELNMSLSNLKILKRIIEHPNGIFFVTGPTGSGKTTTLYAVLKDLNKPGINIMTIEDPVEYRLPGINQIQVNHAIQLDFSIALRAFLRQDPDVILVGEVRDRETAKIASEAALTGHLVLTTLHTNNALQAITRLIEIGVEPYLVAPAVIGVMAQRLVRKICDNCKEAYQLTPEQIDEIFLWDGKTEVAFYRGKGCDQCGNTGYKGRIAIHEIFIIDDEIRICITNNASSQEIRNIAKTKGFKTMRYDGIKKVLQGLTTLDEVERVTVADEIA